MKSIELTKPLTTESLLKEFESRFNMTMDLSKFNEEELQDYANHVRTKIHEITQNTHFGQELKDNNYQKSQMMLDIINQEVSQRKLEQMGGNTDNPVLDIMISSLVSGLKNANWDKEDAIQLIEDKFDEYFEDFVKINKIDKRLNKAKIKNSEEETLKLTSKRNALRKKLKTNK